MSETNVNAVNDAQQTAVESAQETDVESGTSSGTPETGAEAGAAPRKQTRSENRGYAQLRREKENSDALASKLITGLQGLGFTGTDPDELLLQLEAQNKSLTVDELRRQKQESQAAVRNSPEYKSLEAQLLSYGRDQDLKAVQEIDPAVQSLDQLGDEFVRLRAAGISAKTAYYALRQGTKPAEKPDDIGEVSGGNGVEGEYFTSEQLDRLTQKDLEDPKVFKKAMKSLHKL